MPIPALPPGVAAAASAAPSFPEGDGPAPAVDTGATVATDALRATPNVPFMYVHFGDDPGNWFVGEVDGVNVWLPYLQQYPVTPGVGGVRTLKSGELPGEEADELVKSVQRRGGTLLPLSLKYRATTPCIDRHSRQGTLYHDVFTRPRVRTGRNKRTVKFTVDTAARNRWLLSLIENGAVPAPAPELLDERKAQRAARVERVAADTNRNEAVRDALVAEAAAEAEVYESAAVPELGGDAVTEAPEEAKAKPKPPRKRKSRAKTAAPAASKTS